MARALQRIVIGLAGLAGLQACYTPPQPYCGFLCGPNHECPADYDCTSLGVCRLTSAPATVTCGPDGGGSIDIDSGSQRDAFSDTTAPTLQVATPTPGATNVSRAAAVTVTFSEPVFDVSDSSFHPYSSVTAVAGTVQALGSPPDFTTYAYVPTAPFAGSDTITVILTTAIHDVAGNALATPVAGQLSWTFMTEP